MVTVDGELDLGTISYWEALVERAATSASTVVLDLSGVTFIDSAGVHALFRMLTELHVKSRSLALVAPPEAPVRRLLEILDLESLVSVHQTVEEAGAG